MINIKKLEGAVNRPDRRTDRADPFLPARTEFRPFFSGYSKGFC